MGECDPGSTISTDAPTAASTTCAVVAGCLGASRVWLVAAERTAAALLGSPVRVLDPSTLDVADLRALAREAHGRGAPLVADVTDAGLGGCEACLLGADIACCRLDLPAGAADASTVLAFGLSRHAAASTRLLTSVLDGLAATCPPSVATLVATAADLPARLARRRSASDAAQVVAGYLACHPAVSSVRYPGLAHDPSHAVATSTLHAGFGPYVSYVRRGADVPVLLDCTDADARALIARLETDLA
jgi:cystathionine beta-lyase/cystathionine gamma-synthase